MERNIDYKSLINQHAPPSSVVKNSIKAFICGGIIPLGNVSTDPWDRLVGDKYEFKKAVVTEYARLTEQQLIAYANGRPCYAWEIENVVIYDEPKPLADFGIDKAPQSWCYVKEVA